MAVLEDSPSPLVKSFIPIVFPQTYEEHCEWYMYCFALCQLWTLAFFILALVPSTVGMIAKGVVSFEIFIHSAHISGIDLLDEKISSKLSLFITQCLSLPWKLGTRIKEYLQVSMNLFQIIFLISLFTIFIRIIVYEIWIPSKYYAICDNQTVDNEKISETYKDTDSKCQEAVEFWTYHIELRNDMAFHATKFIIIFSYDKFALFLWNVHKNLTRKSLKEQMTKCFTHPILTLPYMALILYLEKFTSILQSFWIIYMMFIFIRHISSTVFFFMFMFTPFFVHSMIFWYSSHSLISWITLIFGRLQFLE